jgi:Lrp/AsnC family leucine-responsive transcriptional regulator
MSRRSSADIDRIDRQLMRHLQSDGRAPIAQLARTVHLSVTPCNARIERLERLGLIRRYFAHLDAEKLGQSLLAYIEIHLDRTTPDIFDTFKNAMLDSDEVLECQMVAGGFDYLLKVRVRDMSAYRRFLGARLAGIRGVMQTHTYFVMEEVKSTHQIKV